MGVVSSLVLIVFLLGSLVSCSVPAVRTGPSQDLLQTVSEFYELRKLGRFDEAWEYERMATDGDRERREKNRKVYLSRSGAMSLRDFTILEASREKSGPEGTTPVRIRLVTDWPVMPFPVPEGDRVTVMEDLWEKRDGKWYHVVRGMTKLW